MKFYIDQETGTVYELVSKMPSIEKIQSQLMVRALNLYGMYRNGLYDTRITKPLDADIAAFKPRYNYKHTNDPTGTDNNHLYHYASYIGIDAMQELFKQEGGQCCVAFKTAGNRKIAVGFLVFYEKTVDDKKLVYISHVSVGQFRQGVGTKLIQTVLMNYPAETTFYLCARKRNEDALRVYAKLGFEMNHQYLTQFGYNPEYFVGMSHVTRPDELSEINRRFTEKPQNEEQSYFCHRVLTR